MSTTESAATISDDVKAEMIDCALPEVPVTAPLPEAPTSTPIADSLAATVEQTGADPPPEV